MAWSPESSTNIWWLYGSIVRSPKHDEANEGGMLLLSEWNWDKNVWDHDNLVDDRDDDDIDEDEDNGNNEILSLTTQYLESKITICRFIASVASRSPFNGFEQMNHGWNESGMDLRCWAPSPLQTLSNDCWWSVMNQRELWRKSSHAASTGRRKEDVEEDVGNGDDKEARPNARRKRPETQGSRNVRVD